MYKLCRHIRTSGGRCRSAALANESYCYYHLTQRRLSITLELPPLEDRHSIQVAVSRVLTSLAAGLIDRRDAGMYLYGIQIASSNLAPEHGCLTPCDPVRRAVLTQNGDEVAEVKTIFEEQDLSGHKKDCTCADCIHTETDDPHHPDCRCGECHCFTDEEEPGELIAEVRPSCSLQAIWNFFSFSRSATEEWAWLVVAIGGAGFWR